MTAQHPPLLLRDDMTKAYTLRLEMRQGVPVDVKLYRSQLWSYDGWCYHPKTAGIAVDDVDKSSIFRFEKASHQPSVK